MCFAFFYFFVHHISINYRQVNLRFQDLFGKDLEDVL